MVSHQTKLLLWGTLLATVILTGLLPAIAHSQTVSNDAAQLDARFTVLVQSLSKTPGDRVVQDDARAAALELLREKDYQQAAKLFIALRAAVPADAAALYGGAVAFFNLRRIEEAEAWVRTLIASASITASQSVTTPAPPALGNLPDALVLLGTILAVKGDNAGSIAALSRAADIAPNSFDARFALGRARYGAGDPGGAARAFRAALAIKPDDAQAHFFLCTALEKVGDDSGALEAYRKFIAVAPNAAVAHLGLGVLLVKLGGAELKEGLTHLEKALALDDKLYEGHVTLGRTLIRLGRLSESIAYLKRASELAPQNPEPHYQLAIAYRRLGKKTEAEAEDAEVKRIHQSRRDTNVSKP
jgi:Flp pilus assembly protein TadD